MTVKDRRGDERRGIDSPGAISEDDDVVVVRAFFNRLEGPTHRRGYAERGEQACRDAGAQQLDRRGARSAPRRPPWPRIFQRRACPPPARCRRGALQEAERRRGPPEMCSRATSVTEDRPFDAV